MSPRSRAMLGVIGGLSALVLTSCGVQFRREVLSSDLFAAVAADDVRHVRQLLDCGAEVNSVYRTKRSLLQSFLRPFGQAQISGLEPPDDDSPLLFAFDGRPRDLSSGYTALRDYPTEDAELVESLLRAGVDANAENGRGERALDKAIDAQQTATCMLLLDYGADPNASPPYREPPLIRCADFGCGLDYGETEAVIGKLLSTGAKVNCRDRDGRTALQIATRWNIAAVRMLLESGADPNTSDRYGESPLSVARGAVPADATTVSLLRQFGARR